jgi:hypothetical protein
MTNASTSLSRPLATAWAQAPITVDWSGWSLERAAT